MTKTKTPFFSLGSRGSIANALTTQGLADATLVRTKSKPTYTYTLPQAYQRWLYEDYVYLWHQQTEATKHAYRLASRPYRLTAFQYWMRYNLRNLPDIVGWWKLDDNKTATTPDSSRNSLTGTIIGCSPIITRIDQGLYFDGQNDTLNLGTNALYTAPDVTIELFFYRYSNIASADPLFNLYVGPTWLNYYLGVPGAPGKARLFDGVLQHDSDTDNPILFDTLYHLAVLFGAGGLRTYLNGQLQAMTDPYSTHWNTGAPSFTMSVQPGSPARLLNAWADNLIFYSRHLDATEILRHSQRRYPPQ